MDQLYGWVWKPQTIRGGRCDRAHFSAKSGQKDEKMGKKRIITFIMTN